LFLILASATAFAGSATWNLNPTSGDWNTAVNWTPATVPSEPADTATFGVSNITNISNDTLHDIEIDGIVFNPGASAFTIAFGNSSFDENYSFNGVGITNNSGITQNFVVADFGDDATLVFKNSATAGEQTVFTLQDSTSHLEFQDTSTAGSATLIANHGGTIAFTGDSTGGTARVQVLFRPSSLDISAHNVPGVTVGSIGGRGDIFLGANNLIVSRNNGTMIFSGTIQDGGPFGGDGPGSLTKIGTSTLVLSRANYYTGGTTISGGGLVVRNPNGSATGSGAVQVDAGNLGGSGIIAGPVTVGTTSGLLAELSPGEKERKLEAITLLSTLAFNPVGIYRFEFNSDNAIADQVIANGVIIRTGAHFFPADLGSSILPREELYDSTVGTWLATGGLAKTRYFHTATLLLDGKVLVAGGVGLSSAELYDPASGTWAATGSLNTIRYRPTATLLLDGKVLVADGSDGSAELYDPATGTWSATGNLSTGRNSHTATLLPNGKVLVAGGFGGLFAEPLAIAELYDPANGTWTGTGSLGHARWAHTATLLPNGKVLVAGGSGGPLFYEPIGSAELYDPASGTWTLTDYLPTRRSFHSATLLPNGKVLVAGGFGGPNLFDPLASAELYDPASGTWVRTGRLATERYSHTATLLPNGNVLAAGGSNESGKLASAELYDPATGTWTATGSLGTARFEQTATLLTDDQVLVAGGYNSIPIGTVFTAISNTSATPITGTFSNLADGSTLTVGPNSYKVSYSGGDGNDLTLTVQ